MDKILLRVAEPLFIRRGSGGRRGVVDDADRHMGLAGKGRECPETLRLVGMAPIDIDRRKVADLRAKRLQPFLIVFLPAGLI